MARANARSARRDQFYTFARRRDVADIDGRIEPRAPRQRNVQIACGEAARIGGIIAETDQRMASLDPISLLHRSGLEQFDFEARASPGVGFERKPASIEDIAVEIDRAARRTIDGKDQPFGPFA